MKLVHFGTFDAKERDKVTSVLRNNLLEAFLLARQNGASDILENDVKLWGQIQEISPTAELTPKIGDVIASAWENPQFQTFIKEKFIFEHFSTAPLLFEIAQRIAEDNFQPNNEEVLYARTKSTGIQEMEFSNSRFFQRICGSRGCRWAAERAEKMAHVPRARASCYFYCCY